MKKIRFNFLLIVSVLLTVLSCSDTNENPVQSGTDGAVVNGDVFTVTETKGSVLANGLELAFMDADNQQINLRLSDNVVGTYMVENANAGGRVKADLVAFAMFIKADGEVFYGASGSLVITALAGGKVTGTYAFEAKSTSGTTVKITGGNFSNAGIATLPSGKCLLTRVLAGDAGGDVNEYGDLSYNSEGQLVQIVTTDRFDYVIGKSNYIWVGDHVAKVFNSSIDDDYVSTSESSWIYKGGKLEKTAENKRTIHDGVTEYSTDSYVFTYNGEGKISKADWLHVGNATYGGAIAYEYDANGNVIKSIETGGGEDNYTHTFVFSGYDAKKSWHSLLAKAVNHPDGYFPSFGVGGESLSNNNPGSVSSVYTSDDGYEDKYTQTYTYEYNAQGYPTLFQIHETGRSTDQFTLIYSGCN